MMKLALNITFQIQIGASDICGNCKQKSIEFYHFKRRSQLKNKPRNVSSLLPPNISSLAQDSIRIVDMYIKKFSIKALRIEESDEKLIIMRKPPIMKLPEIPVVTEPPRATSVEPEIKQEPIDDEDEMQVKPEIEADSCVKFKIEPDLIIEDIGEDSADSVPLNSPIPEQNEPQTPPEQNLNQIDVLLSMNEQIFHIVREINSKVDSLEQNIGRVEKMYESEESGDEHEPSGPAVPLPENLKCETLPEVLYFNRILQNRENQRKLKTILKERLAAFNDNYKLLLKEGLNILMTKQTQYLISHDGQSVLKSSRAVKCLLKITHEIFGTPVQHIERYLYHQLFMKKSITAFS